MIKKKKKRKVDPQKSWAAKVAHARRRIAQEFSESYKPGDWVTVVGRCKTMGMLLTEPYQQKSSWDGKVHYVADIQLRMEDGEHVSYILSTSINYIRKFKPWPYFYGRKDKTNDRQSSEEARTTS